MAAALNGPTIRATRGIMKKWMGMPRGVGMEREESAKAAAARSEVVIISLCLSSTLDSL